MTCRELGGGSRLCQRGEQPGAGGSEQHWPRTPAPQLPPEHRRLPGIPVLLLGGDRDLSTPLEWLYDQKKLTPRARVVVVPGAAHSVQTRAVSDKGRQAVFDFLLRR
ncbi:alpha/beta hydrolase [Streptomyces sp. NBC_01481]|uniref:alpha/beta hydrolase n=1 Tax=Streptomyces sp. NBC_01481 TaxID=2975869 RepID=UPI0022503DBF|nr:alpha/beta hydrolase [Streptomyces sp. NBC_01481]MCX4586140.1 alpha/beta hydrolase [Streptomyces sp. NBC_01481]